MKRKKRKYISLIIAAIILLCSIAVLHSTLKDMFLYEKTQATIVSVETEEREGGTSDDRYYYTESELHCRYTVNGCEYKKVYVIKGDYSGQEGKTINVLYNKEKPYESILEQKNTIALLYSIAFIAGCTGWIVFDIRKWVKIRKQENEEASQAYFSDADMQQYEAKKRKQKRINIVMIIISALLFVLIYPISIPFIIYTAARITDYRLCYKSISTNSDLKNIPS